jgi:hypothetical protein
MNSISDLFQQAQLAEAAYANLTSAIGNQTALKQARTLKGSTIEFADDIRQREA